MYRAVTLGLSDEKIGLNDKKMLVQFLESLDIYLIKIIQYGLMVRMFLVKLELLTSSKGFVSANPLVNRMVKIQRIIASDINCVLLGRDIGTFVFPNADFKFFLN